jgi:uncharacterized membrane protein YqaE (UPF0057 family)
VNYRLAILLPPVAVAAVGGGCGSILLNVLLTVCFYFPGLAHAVYVIRRAEDARR